MKRDEHDTQSDPRWGPDDTREDPSAPRDDDRVSGSSENDGGSLPLAPPASSLRARLARSATGRVRLGRYEVVRLIGEGGMGEVYEAIHVQRRERVALKTLLHLSGRNLYRFKNEFRSLVGVVHPNLVALHELAVEDGIWFFTMDLVDGVSFDAHAALDGRARSTYLGRTFNLEERPWSEPRVTEAEMPPLIESPSAPPELPRATFHEGRLRAALCELAIGVAALHARGLTHRDLNPTNVLVTVEGRVVVLDFGLICGDRERVAALDAFSGTPSYMSPEQSLGKLITPASDWYSVGVMLFEALTGRLPFRGNNTRLLRAKQENDGPRPSSVVSGVPRDLDDLCVALLQKNPGDRPDGRDILDRVGAPNAPCTSRPRAPWVARHAELAAIARAYRDALHGEDACVLVHGAEGMGKTALCERFLESAEGPRPLVLRGAASSIERIPRQPIDPIVDALALHLQSLDHEAAKKLLPPEARELARVFPVLEGILAIDELPEPPRDASGKRWASALAEIMRRLAAGAPLVVWLDDIERAGSIDWLIDAVLGAPVDGTRRPLLVLSGSGVADGAPARARRVPVAPLPHGDACALVKSAMGIEGKRGEEIADDAKGVPALVAELAAFVDATRKSASVEAMHEWQIDHLPPPALRLAEVLAVAHESLPQGVAFGIAELAGKATAAVQKLAAARLARSSGPDVTDTIALHPRAREMLHERIGSFELKRILGEIASRLDAWPGTDPAVVARYMAQAGRLDEAAERAIRAAARASAARDHGLAATILARASDWLAGASPELVSALEAKRGEALAEGGRAVEAARAFLSAARLTTGEPAMDLKRRAAELLIVSGRIEEGVQLQKGVLAAHGIEWPETPRTALFRLAAGLVKLRLRGSAIPDWAEREAPPAARARIEALWSTGKGLSWIDPIRSAAFMVEAAYAALTESDVVLSARGLAFVGCLYAYGGGTSDERRGNAMIEEAAALAGRRRDPRDPYLVGFVRCCTGISRMCAGLWREAAARMDEGFATLSERGGALVWEAHAHRLVASQTLFALGSLAERARVMKRSLEEARVTGDRYGQIEAELAMAFARTVAGEPAEARRDAETTIARYYGDAFTLQHNTALWIEVTSLLYEGAHAEAWERLERATPALHGSQLLRIQLARIEADLLRGVTAASLAAVDRSRTEELVDVAEEAAARLARERRTHASAAASIVRAGVALARGGIAANPRALQHLREASADYDAAEMKVHAACARRAMAGLLVSQNKARLAAQAEAVLRAEGVADPARFTRMYTGITVPPSRDARYDPPASMQQRNPRW